MTLGHQLNNTLQRKQAIGKQTIKREQIKSQSRHSRRYIVVAGEVQEALLFACEDLVRGRALALVVRQAEVEEVHHLFGPVGLVRQLRRTLRGDQQQCLAGEGEK